MTRRVLAVRREHAATSASSGRHPSPSGTTRPLAISPATTIAPFRSSACLRDVTEPDPRLPGSPPPVSRCAWYCSGPASARPVCMVGLRKPLGPADAHSPTTRPTSAVCCGTARRWPAGGPGRRRTPACGPGNRPYRWTPLLALDGGGALHGAVEGDVVVRGGVAAGWRRGGRPPGRGFRPWTCAAPVQRPGGEPGPRRPPRSGHRPGGLFVSRDAGGRWTRLTEGGHAGKEWALALGPS